MNESPGLRGGLWESFTWRHALFVYLLLTGVLFADVLFTGDDVVLSAKYLDLYAGEMSGMEFQLRELAQGNLPLWNPHVFSGTPNLSTPLYPSNLLGLLLAPAKAVNGQIALHVFLIGFFMYLWASRRGLHPLASLASGVMIMFSGSFYLHVYAGHMGNLFAMAWVPLLFLAVDAILDRPSPGPVAGGSVVAAMQILTGQYQYVYYTALAASVYVLLHLRFITPPGRRWTALGALCAIPAGAVALSAFNLFPSLSASTESVRSAGVSYEFASMFSLPPENLLTLVIPFFFGDMTSIPYWGRCYLWEMCLFAGITGLVFAVYGAVCGEKDKRRHIPIMVLIMAILALGVHTPLFSVLFNWLPGFSSFRGTSKFAFQAVVFVALLAGIGLDGLIRRRAFPRAGILLACLAGLGLLSFSLWLFHVSSDGTAEGLWMRLVLGITGTGESYLPASLFQNAAFVAQTAGFAARGVLIAATVLLAAALLLWIANKDSRAVYLLLLLILLEGFVFAWVSRPVFHYRETFIPEFRKFYAARAGDYRVLNRVLPNSAMSTGSRDIWGYGPMVLKRYAEFMAVTQGVDPDRASTYLPLHAYHPLWDLLRVRFILMPAKDGIAVREMESGIPRVQLLTDWKTAKTRNEVLALLTDPAFDPRRTVILEESPGIIGGSPLPVGTCSIRDDGGGRMIVNAKTDRAAILLIAENYSNGWRIESMGQQPPAPYRLVPADHTLMAVSLSPGEHAFTVRYRPRSFVTGTWISATAWILLAGWAAAAGIRRLRRVRP
ncbi:MAG: hypothetical protein HPY65_03985 [Syntrophaceae bacterium]|nr:hypothetical protein [Syntrophaceae bacterium]